MKPLVRIPFLLAGLILAGAGCVRIEPSTPPSPSPTADERPPADEPAKPATTPGVPEADTAPAAKQPDAASVPEAAAPSGPLTAASFPILAKATRFINENQGKAPGDPQYETIQDLVVADTDKPGTYYFATSAYDAARGENFVGIYSIEEVTYNWWRAYKKAYKRGEDGSAPVQLRAVGKEGRTLYLVADVAGVTRTGKTPVADVGPLYALDLDAPLNGLTEVADAPAFLANVNL